VLKKDAKIVSNKYRDSARMEECTLRIPGICNYDPATTILAHLPSEWKGLAIKSPDICGVYACSSCHDYIDGRGNKDMQGLEKYMLQALQRTLVRAYEKGILKI